MCHSVCVICTDAVDSLSGPRRCPQFLHDYKKYVTHLITPFTPENIVYKITVTKSISNRRSSQVSLARPIPSTAATRPLLSRLVGVTMTVTWLVAHRIWLGKVHKKSIYGAHSTCRCQVMSRPSGAVKRDTKLSFFACCLARIISITQIHDSNWPHCASNPTQITQLTKFIYQKNVLRTSAATAIRKHCDTDSATVIALHYTVIQLPQQ